MKLVDQSGEPSVFKGLEEAATSLGVKALSRLVKGVGSGVQMPGLIPGFVSHMLCNLKQV